MAQGRGVRDDHLQARPSSSAAGDNGGKEATARAAQDRAAETERVIQELQHARKRRLAATEKKIADLHASLQRPLRPSAIASHQEAAGLKDEIRKTREAIENLKAMMTLGETEFRAAR